MPLCPLSLASSRFFDRATEPHQLKQQPQAPDPRASTAAKHRAAFALCLVDWCCIIEIALVVVVQRIKWDRFHSHSRLFFDRLNNSIDKIKLIQMQKTAAPKLSNAILRAEQAYRC